MVTFPKIMNHRLRFLAVLRRGMCCCDNWPTAWSLNFAEQLWVSEVNRSGMKTQPWGVPEPSLYLSGANADKNPALVYTNRAQTRPEFQSDLIRFGYFLCLVMLHLPLWLSGPRCFIHLLVFCSIGMRCAPENFKLNLHASVSRLQGAAKSQLYFRQ